MTDGERKGWEQAIQFVYTWVGADVPAREVKTLMEIRLRQLKNERMSAVSKTVKR